VLAALHDAPLIHHQDQVGIHDALDAVGDDEGGAVFHQVLQRFADLGFGFGVDRGGRVIQDQDARVFEQGAGNRHALLLPAREGDARSPTRVLVTVREGQDHIVDGGGARGGFDFFVGTSRPTP
jgi:hypothetical protein